MVARRWNESDEAKSSYVKALFSALATRYDVMTDVWTFARDLSSRDPNWKLVATEAGQ